jgi:hypothetical protein
VQISLVQIDQCLSLDLRKDFFDKNLSFSIEKRSNVLLHNDSSSTFQSNISFSLLTDNKDLRLKSNLNLKRSSVRHFSSSSSSSYSSPIDRTTSSKESLYKKGTRRRRIYQTDIQVKDLFFKRKKSSLFGLELFTTINSFNRISIKNIGINLKKRKDFFDLNLN